MSVIKIEYNILYFTFALVVFNIFLDIGQDRNTNMQNILGPGSQGLSPVPSPLRTVRDSFPSHGSSHLKANPCGVTHYFKMILTF